MAMHASFPVVVLRTNNTAMKGFLNEKHAYAVQPGYACLFTFLEGFPRLPPSLLLRNSSAAITEALQGYHM